MPMIKKIAMQLIPHISIAFALVTLTFLILYQFNPSIIVSDFVQVIFYIFCILSLATSVLMILLQIRSGKSK
jgi:hypothetical protein